MFPQGLFGFCLKTFIISMFALISDIAYTKITGKKSLLGLTYGQCTGVSRVVFFWGLGAFFVAYFGGLVSIFQYNMQACMALGFGWPAIFPRVISNILEKEPAQMGIGVE